MWRDWQMPRPWVGLGVVCVPATLVQNDCRKGRERGQEVMLAMPSESKP